MRPSRFRLPALVAVLLVFTFATGVLAGTGRGAAFNLGVVNSVTGYVTKLTGAMAGPMLYVVNTSTTSAARALRLDNASATVGTLYALNTGGGTAAEFIVNAGRPPIRVNSTGKVANLNADQLDNLDSNALQKRVTGICSPGSMVTAINALGTVVCEADDDTTYTGAEPIVVSEGQIGLSMEKCDHGWVYKASEGGWTCAPDAVDGGDAATLGGVAPSGFVQGPVEAWHVIGAPGEPGFGDCKANGTKWTNFGGVWSPAAFYKDPLGRVHIRGLIRCIGGYEGPRNLVFTLPAGSTPAYHAQFSGLTNSSGNPYVPIPVNVGSGGDVRLGTVNTGTEAWTSLEGISFRAAP